MVCSRMLNPSPHTVLSSLLDTTISAPTKPHESTPLGRVGVGMQGCRGAGAQGHRGTGVQGCRAPRCVEGMQGA